MECLLCSIWNQMSYSKRPTTPVSAPEAEGVLIVGYWITSRQTTVPRICERHMSILARLDLQENQRAEAERVTRETAKLSEPYQRQIADFQRRRELVYVAPQQPQQDEPIVSFGMPAPTMPVPIATDGQFKLGPGPLTNENNITPHPGLIPAAPPQPLHAQPGTIEGALEAARMPPIEGGKVMYKCQLCGEEVITGDVHAC